MNSFIKISITVFAALFFNNANAQIQYYTVQDDDVNVFEGYILSLTEQGEENIKDTNIIFPETLHGQNIIGMLNINDKQTGLFQSKNLHFVKLPKTLEYIGRSTFYGNYNMILCNFKELIFLKYIGVTAFVGIKGIDDSMTSLRLDLNNLSKLEIIGLGAFALGQHNIKTVDFTNCTNLRAIGFFAFYDISGEKEDKTLDSLIFKNCKNLSYIGEYGFSSYTSATDSVYQENINQKYIDFSNCQSILYVGATLLGKGINNFSYIENLLVAPQINNLTFEKWKKIYYYGSVTYFALFEESVISINELVQSTIFGLKNSPQTYQEMLTYIPQQKNAKDSKLVKFEIRNHSINNIEISNILCTTQGCTLDWTNGTIETGKTQTVTVTYPEGTEDYTATITIEGENLMGNTTVNVGETGGVTTDDNLLSGVAQQNIQDGNLFKLSPNPTNNFINIQLNDFNTQSPTDIEIYNMQGKLMYKNKITERETKIDITEFTPNNYLVMIKKDDKYGVKQVIKH